MNAAPLRRIDDATAPAAREVPAVKGLALRDAALRLHEAGFRVVVEGSGPAVETVPKAGVKARPGSVVRVRGKEAER